MASVESGNQARDEHLRSADFFDTACHPTATFSAHAADWQGTVIVARATAGKPVAGRHIGRRRGTGRHRRGTYAGVMACLSAHRGGRT
jgi:hypothetical protein